MHRSASTNRIWDSHISYHHHQHHLKDDEEDLPTYNPYSDAAKKEKAVARFTENLIHVIPFLLLFCAFLLWFFSNPTAGKIQGYRSTIEADLDSDGMGNFPLDLGYVDPTELGHFRNSILDN